jgi:hypothetical protein
MTGLGVGPDVVSEMDMRRLNDLMDYWIDHPPSHVATAQTRDVVISALGGTPPTKQSAAARAAGLSVNGRSASPEQFAAMFGVTLPESA